MQKLFFDDFLAKSDGITTLQMHTEHVIKAGENLIDKLSFSKEEKEFWLEKMYRSAVLHDLGKIHIDFQKRLVNEEAYPIRHEIISLWFCINFLDLSDDEMFAIATHHKGIVNTKYGTGRLEINVITTDLAFLYDKQKELLTKETLQKWLDLFQLNLSVKEDSVIQAEIPQRFAKILNCSYQQKVVLDIEKRKQCSFTRALLIASDHIGSARKENDIPQYKRLITSQFQPVKDGLCFPFRAFQEKLQTITTDLILHAPTGSGKTEAALSWITANQTDNSRLFYLLPYTASINAMVTRLQEVYGEEVVTALHSKTLDFFYNQLSNEDSNKEKDFNAIENEARSKKFLSGELFYPVKVATLHQILKTSLKGKGWEFSLYDYKNALFIIDEFHTYDALLTGMLLSSIKLFRKLFNAKFLFMSATIPDFMLNIIIEEIFDGDKKKLIRPDKDEESDRIILDRKRHHLHCKSKQTIEDNIDLINDYLEDHRSVLIIVNNVKTAQQLYNDIKFSGSVQLLHSGFNKRDRTRIEELITNKNTSKRPQLLIATQAVEVSLDIDYDVSFIENAPIDALIQRFGRVNRAGKKEISSIDKEITLSNRTVPIYLIENSIGNTPFYDESVLVDTWDFLLNLDGKELSENDLISICNLVYKNGYTENQKEDFINGLTHPTITNFEEEWIAGDWNDWIEDLIEHKNKKVEILCTNLEVEYKEKIKEKRFLEANQLLVQVYNYEIKKVKKLEKTNTLVALNLFYDPIVGYIKKEDDISFDERSL